MLRQPPLTHSVFPRRVVVAIMPLPPCFSGTITLYECSCGNKRSLPRIYFCRHCLKLRCRDCLSHEVDSQYCQHCLEYIPTIDAKLKKNKCSSCYSCPECRHTLLPRVYLQTTKSESEVVQKKQFYLSCFFCRWTTRDVDLADQQSGAGSWPELETPEAGRLSGIGDFYRRVAQREKVEKEKKRISPRGNAIHLLDKYGISAVLSPKVTETLRAKYYAKISPTGAPSALSEPFVDAAVARNEAEDLALDYGQINLMTDLNQISSIDQRLQQIETQPDQVSKFHPMSQMLSVKRSLRCKECDHNLSKPEYNPSSIKFKILLAAYNHVPEIKLVNPPSLVSGQKSTILLTLHNPTPYKLNVILCSADSDPNCNFELIESRFTVPAKDDTLYVDVGGDKVKPEKECDIVSWRRGNKVGLTVDLVPINVNSDVILPLLLKHDFVNSVVQIQGSEKMETQISWVTHRVYVRLNNF